MIITVDKVNKTYKNGSLELQVLKNISFKVDKGEFLAIMGSSGSGKSTMMNILACLDSQYEGTYILDGIDISKLTENQLSEIRNKKIGFIFQSFNLLPRLSALENVELPLVYSSVPKAERHKRAAELLETGEYSVNAVADMVGFANQHYFSTVFKQYMGKSPKQYGGGV